MKTTLLALAMSLTFAAAYAQSEERILNSEPIDVDGYLHERQVTDHELEQIRGEIRKQKTESSLNKEKTKGFKELSKTTEKLSETTEEYLDEKKDAQKDIAEYNAKIKCLMEENPGADCDKYTRNRKEESEGTVVQEVVVAQSAPAAVSVIETREEKIGMGDQPFETIKLIMDAGATNYSGDKENLSATAAGLHVESNINNRFSMGFGMNYAQLTTQDYANQSFGSNAGFYNPSSYYDAYGSQGREIQFKKFGVDANGKFFITQGRRFRPFVGMGLGFNTASLNYTKNNSYSYGNNNYGGETYKTNYVTGTLMMGTEIMITSQIGLNLMATYSTGLGSGLSNTAGKNTSNNPDQRRLGQLATDIVNSNALSMFAGLVFVF
jgi:hypothetical protein